jgi:hypothetical protein
MGTLTKVYIKRRDTSPFDCATSTALIPDELEYSYEDTSIYGLTRETKEIFHYFVFPWIFVGFAFVKEETLGCRTCAYRWKSFLCAFDSAFHGIHICKISIVIDKWIYC